MKKRKILLGLAMAAMAVFTLSGCGDDNAPSPIVDAGEGSEGGQTGGQTGEGTIGGQTGGQTGEGTTGGQTGGQTGEGTTGGQTGGQTGGSTYELNVDESKLVSSNPGSLVTKGEVNVLNSAGMSESATITYDNVNGADSYNIYVDGALVDNKIAYTQKVNGYVKTELLGLTKGTHEVEIAAVKGGLESNGVKTKVSLNILNYDRSGYAHFNYNEGVGAYNNDGTLKENAIVLYVTDANKNTVELSYNGKIVNGIGNILNSVGKECDEADHKGQCKKVSSGKTYYGKANTNQGILLDLAQDNIPLVVRFVGCVSDSGLNQPGTFNASTASLIQGLTAYDGVDYGGSVGDNGHMARMKSAKNLTLEGVGNDAIIDGWGFHLMCESEHPDLAKNFEVRNLTFMNTPEDAVGMEGVENESSLIQTAPVERCWIHHNNFLCPNIASPAEGDKSEGDGSCDFKRGNYLTCSYNYFEDCHKTNLIGSGDSDLQFNITFHHNIWYHCGSRMPKSRRSNIHFYNNLIVGSGKDGAGTADLAANAYMYAENNYYLGAKNPVMDNGNKSATKLYGNVMVGCHGATVPQVASRETQVDSQCEYAKGNLDFRNFDTNPEVFYYDSVNKRSDCYLTDANAARIECIANSGSRYRTVLDLAKQKISPEVTNVASSATISGDNSLTLSKAKGVIKVFTVTTPVTITIAATSKVGYDTGYLLKIDGTFVLALAATEKQAVLENGVYVIVSGQSFTGEDDANDKETTVTTCRFEKFDSDEFNEKLIEDYNNAVAAIPSTIEYNDATYNLIKAAMDKYEILGDLKSQVTNYETNVVAALNEYKNLGKTAVEAAISAIGTVTSESGNAITSARSLYNAFVARFNDVTISNYDVLTAAEGAYSSFAIDACKNAISAIGTVTLDSKDAIETAEGLYATLTDDQKKAITNYAKLIEARTTYDNLVAAKSVDDLINSVDLTSIDSMQEVIDAYDLLTSDQKALVSDQAKMNQIKVQYVISLIDAIGTVDNTKGALISKARAEYDKLDSTLKSNVINYSTLTDAEATFEELVVDYTKTYSSTETLSANTGTTADGFTYSCNGFSNGIMKIRNNNSNFIKLDNIESSSVTVSLTAKMNDTSNNTVVSFVCEYKDGTTETKTVTINGTVSTNEVTFAGGIVKSVSFVGSIATGSKNVAVQSISVTYKK